MIVVAPKPTGSLQDEANRLQHLATEPDAPVWVGASAGSGKTRVLVGRLLRLMLPSKGRIAAAPNQILCITFTKAGASEVMDRVVTRLRNWTIAVDDTLKSELTALLEETPDTATLKKARALFADVIEAPGGMKIMTIHAFCESVLARFPMEAGLPAGFEVMDETESRALMRDVRRSIITRLQRDEPADKALKTAFDHLSAIRSANDIESLMEHMMAERGRLRALLAHHNGITGLTAAVEHALNVAANQNADILIQQFMAAVPEVSLRALLPRLSGCATATNKECADTLAAFFALQDRVTMLEEYQLIFLTAKNEPRKLVGSIKDDDHAQKIFAAEAARLQHLDSQLRNIATATATNSLLRFSAEALESYEREKRRRNRLDFEDLIDRTKRLLSGDGVNWVQYKLDGGIDHILVDEAQDTNPDQWDIITALYDEFYAGSGMREDLKRTTFVVGDEKQSIFSFQRADPRVFAQMHDRLDTATLGAQKTIPMSISFRSSPSVLRMVDAVFAPPEMRAGVLQDPTEIMHHDARHTGKAGRVELWPLIKKPAKEPRAPWSLPVRVEAGENPIAQMADQIALNIKTLLTQKLESKGRMVRPGDIMILLAKRKPLAEPILKALRAHNIPVSGIDRMVVSKQLSVRDVLAACAFVLQPDDDLNLAALLKSPFIGAGEQTLFNLSSNRGRRPLWQAVKDADGPIAAWLSGLLTRDGSVSSFLHHLLFAGCPADKHSGMRAILARLGEDVRDPLQELLARADEYDVNDVRGLQGFVQDTINDDSQIKRDLQESDNRVRLMTVHGSKGLEAPIVIMPDTIRARASRNLKDAVLWPDRKDAGGVPLWLHSGPTAADAYRARGEALKERGDEEYRRLLYVALTRAADRLYVGGVQKFRDQDMDAANSWYFKCEAAIKQIGTQDNGVWHIENRQTDTPKDDAKESRTKTAAPIEPWMWSPAPDAGSPPRPLMPSRPEGDDPAVMSPLFGDISHRYQRGRIIHTLFQFLPELPEEERLPRAIEWLNSPSHNLNVAAQNEILEATFNVLNDPAFASIFTSAGRPEVPLTGHLTKPDGTHAIVSGQVDRLVVGESQVTVLDYKTNRPAPKTLAEVPDAYRRQMRTYRDILAQIWPGKPIRCALLWTDGPALMDVTDSL